MPIDNDEAPKANFFYVDKDGNYHPLGEFTFHADINMSEEAEAMFWAQMEGLEIVEGE